MLDDTLANPMRAVAVVGSVSIDRNRIGARSLLKLGGAASYAGLTYLRLGLSARVLCNVAPADAAICTPLRDAGIQVLNGRTEHTTRFVNRLDKEERVQRAPSLAAPIRYRRIAAVLKRVECLHLGPLHPEDIEAHAYGRLAACGALVVLDVQGLVRKKSRGRLVSGVSKHLTAALQAASIVKADRTEADRIVEAYGTGIEALMERFGIAEWAVTAGADGGCIHARRRRPESYQAVPAGRVVDPTGAGDVFLAAYTEARFRQRLSVPSASRRAAGLAAAHVAGRLFPAALLGIGRRPKAARPANIDIEANEV